MCVDTYIITCKCIAHNVCKMSPKLAIFQY